MIYISERKAEELMEQHDVEYDVIESYRKYLGRAEMKNYAAKKGRTAFSDSTKQKTYDAENKFMRAYGRMGVITEEYANQLAQMVFDSAAWKDFANHNSAARRAPKVTFRKMRRHSGLAYHDTVTLNNDGRGNTLYILLHELAHCAGHRHHDIMFRKCVVAFVAMWNRDMASKLEKAFKDEGLKMREPKVKEMMPFDKWLKKYNHMKARVRPHHPKA